MEVIMVILYCSQLHCRSILSSVKISAQTVQYLSLQFSAGTREQEHGTNMRPHMNHNNHSYGVSNMVMGAGVRRRTQI